VSDARHRVQIQVRLNEVADRDRIGARQDSGARGHIGNAGLCVDALRLPQSFVAGKKESSVFYDRTTKRTTKLISLDRRLAAAFVLLPLRGIQCIVAKELV